MENATITDLGNGDILAMVKSVPEGEFLVVMTGTDKESNSEFQRQSTTSMSVSKVNIQVFAFFCSSLCKLGASCRVTWGRMEMFYTCLCMFCFFRPTFQVVWNQEYRWNYPSL